MSLETSCLDNGISSTVTLDISNKRRIERTRERSYISDRHLDQEVYCKCACACVYVGLCVCVCAHGRGLSA